MSTLQNFRNIVYYSTGLWKKTNDGKLVSRSNLTKLSNLMIMIEEENDGTYLILKGDKYSIFADSEESGIHLEPKSDQTFSKWELQLIEGSEWYTLKNFKTRKYLTAASNEALTVKGKI